MKAHHMHDRNRLGFDGRESQAPPMELYKHIHNRQIRQTGRFSPFPRKVVSEFTSQYFPNIYQERNFTVGKMNKIFAAQWISEKQVVLGTKCNKLAVMDILDGSMINIPSLKSSEYSEPANCPCGIHSITINPSKTLLATGGINTNDLALYKLPTFDPLCVGEGGHSDWIFDINWLDDEYLVTGSRDNKLCLWRAQDSGTIDTDTSYDLVPDYPFIKPVSVLRPRRAEKIRALSFNKNSGCLAALSLNAYLHLIDVRTFQQVASKSLQHAGENVCMCIGSQHNLYAIGSQSHVTFVDARDGRKSKIIESKQKGSGIRSVSFNENIVTIGTGAGRVFFFDIRKQSYLELSCGKLRGLQTSHGWLQKDDTFRNYFMFNSYPPAVYSHCYDEYGTRLFTAGGPLPAGLWGNYAAVWQ